MDIIYVDYDTRESKIDINNYYSNNYNMIKNDSTRTMCGFFLYIEKIIGLCILLKKEDYIQIIVFHMDNISEILVRKYIEHIFLYIKNENYNKIKIINTKGLKSLERYIYGAECIDYDLYNSNMEDMEKEDLINIEKYNEKEKKLNKFDKYQIIYFKNNKSCELYCC
jgi:hypothetical protein